MTDGLTNETANRIRRVLARFPEIDRAMLYGSRAKGNYRTGSDIDLALIGVKLDHAQLAPIATALDDLSLPYKIDICIFNKIEHRDLIDHINRVGVVWYQKKPAAAMDR
jgi:predicted nucleotidyltransferase